MPYVNLMFVVTLPMFGSSLQKPVLFEIQGVGVGLRVVSFSLLLLDRRRFELLVSTNCILFGEVLETGGAAFHDVGMIVFWEGVLGVVLLVDGLEVVVVLQVGFVVDIARSCITLSVLLSQILSSGIFSLPGFSVE